MAMGALRLESSLSAYSPMVVFEFCSLTLSISLCLYLSLYPPSRYLGRQAVCPQQPEEGGFSTLAYWGCGCNQEERLCEH